MTEVMLVAIVDDDGSFRRAMTQFVESLGHTAYNFPSALDFLRSDELNETACLICDLHMPGMDGHELQYWLYTHGYSMPIIFVSAYGDTKSRQKAFDLGAVGYFDKPFDEQEMISCIDRALLPRRT